MSGKIQMIRIAQNKRAYFALLLPVHSLFGTHLRVAKYKVLVVMYDLHAVIIKSTYLQTHQALQRDFLMPERFDLNYIGADGEKHRPIVIHRIIFET